MKRYAELIRKISIRSRDKKLYDNILDYRGEIKVILVNLSNEPFTVEPNERIAQLVFAKHEQIRWEPCLFLDETERGEGGFESTGRK